MEHPTFNDLPVEIVIMIINSGVSPLWPKYPDQRKDRTNWQLVNKCWKAAVEDQTVAICEFPRLCAHATQDAIIKQILNLDLQYNARQPHPHNFLQDPDLHHNHDLCELDTHNLVQESMQQLLNRGLDAPASVLLAMDKKYDRFLLAQMCVFHYTAHRETMTMLASNGMDVNQVHPILGETALISAIKHPDIDDDESAKIVRRLLDHGANIDTVGAEKYSAVLLAAKSNKPRTTRLLLNRGAQVPFHFRDFVERVAQREFGDRGQGEFNGDLEFAFALATLRALHDPDGDRSW